MLLQPSGSVRTVIRKTQAISAPTAAHPNRPSGSVRNAAQKRSRMQSSAPTAVINSREFLLFLLNSLHPAALTDPGLPEHSSGRPAVFLHLNRICDPAPITDEIRKSAYSVSPRFVSGHIRRQMIYGWYTLAEFGDYRSKEKLVGPTNPSSVDKGEQ